MSVLLSSITFSPYFLLFFIIFAGVAQLPFILSAYYFPLIFITSISGILLFFIVNNAFFTNTLLSFIVSCFLSSITNNSFWFLVFDSDFLSPMFFASFPIVLSLYTLLYINFFSLFSLLTLFVYIFLSFLFIPLVQSRTLFIIKKVLI